MNNISRNIYNSFLSSMGKKIDYQLPCESWTAQTTSVCILGENSDKSIVDQIVYVTGEYVSMVLNREKNCE